MSRSDRHAPPPLAMRLLEWVTPQPLRAAILGDLAEEFASRQQQSFHAADRWYWRQALRSLTALTLLRIRTQSMPVVLSVIVTTLLGVLVATAWDVLVARQSAAALAAIDSAPNLVVIRTLYFVLMATGAGLIGALTARWVFRRHWSFHRNGLVFLGPLMLALVVLAWVATLTHQLIGYAILKTTLVLLAMVICAYGVTQRRRFRSRA